MVEFLLFIVLMVVCKYLIKYVHLNNLINKYEKLNKNFIIYEPSWWSILLSVEQFSPDDHIDKNHVDYKVGQGLDRIEAEIEEELIVWEMQFPKYDHCRKIVYFMVKDGVTVKMINLDEYIQHLIGYLTGYRILKDTVVKDITND